MKKKELKQKLKRQKKRSAYLRERLDKAEAKIVAEKTKSSRLKSELQSQTHRYCCDECGQLVARTSVRQGARIGGIVKPVTLGFCKRCNSHWLLKEARA